MSSSSVVADSDPACATALPSAPSGSSLLGSYSATTVTEGPSILRAKTATRTYGKPRPVVDEDVATTTAPDSAATEVQATPGLERVDARLIARKTSLVVVPESDLDLGARDVHRSSSYSSPQNHGSIESRQKAKNMFSPAGRRGHDSTDPTSEEVTGDADATMRQPKDRKIVHEVVAAPSSSQTSTDSDNGDEDDEDGAAAFFKKGNWKDQLAEMDQDDFDFDSLPTVVVEKTTPAADTTLVFSTQSTLTSLPTSDGPVAKVGRVSASARPGVVSDDEEESDEGAARTKSKTQRRVINSDDDSDADAGETFKAGKGRPAVIATSSVEDIDNVEEDALPLSKKKPKGAISKKEEDLMHRETAALRREQDFRLAPRVKSAPKIMDILHKTQHYRPVVAPTRKKFLGPIPSLPTKKAEPAPAPDSPIRGSSPPPRDSSPIEDTPTAIRRQVIIPPTLARSSGPLKSFTAAPVDDDNDDDDDDEELPTLEKVFEEQAKAEERRKYHEHKVAAAKRAEEDRLKRLLSVAPDEEEDSDLEFEVVKPTARSRSERHATPTSDVHRTVHVASVSRSARKIRDLDINIPAQNHDEDDETAAQTALLMRGRGKKPKGWVPRMKSLEPKKTNNAEFDSIEALNDRLLGKSAMKNIDERTRKQVQARRKMEGVVKTDGVAKVNVDHLLKTKDENIKAAKQREEEDEDAEDADWAEEEDEDDDERGSDAESDDEAGSGDEMIEDEAEDDSAAEDEDEEVTPPVVVKRRVRLQSASDEEDDEEETIKNDVNASSPQAIKGVELPSFLDSQPDRGFSQFFDDDVSQAFGEANESGDGFNRRGTQKLAAEETASQEAAREHGLYLTKTQRMADNQALEERAAFAGELSPGTPGPGYDPPPRVYINKEGLMTQTRPLNLFGAASMESPLGLTFSPLDSASRPRFSLDSSSQRPTGMTQTQLAETQTPTQASKDPSRLRRANAVIGYDSISELAATEVEPVSTEVEGFETQETDQQESFPSAAQPTAPNAFEIMRQAAMQQSILPALVEDMQRESRRKDANAFIEQEADLSDEEGGALGRLSGDEDETNLDDELESLVDHDEIAPELAAEQDALVNDLHAQILAKQDADELAKAQAIADGKERNRRKGLDIDDDDFDDDFGISTKRAEKRPRIENFSTAQLQANEETRPFALNITEGLVTSVRQSDIDYLAEPEGGESGSDDDDEFVDEAGTSDADGEGNSAMAPPPRKISMREANELALERSRRKELERRTSPLLEVRLGNGQSSSPVALPKVKNRALLAKTVVSRPRPSDDFELLDSQYALVNRTSASRVAYNNSGDARDESQGSGKGTTAGKNSAVTSFKRTASNASLVSNRSDGSTGSKKGKALGSTSRAMSFRRNAFET